MSAVDYALRYSEIGLHVIPLWHVIDGRCACHAGARCDRRGKHPRLKDWQRRATVDRREIERWFRHAGNVGVVCGPSRVVAIDVDHPGTHDEDGFTTLGEIERAVGPMPRTPTADTGGDGVHFVYRDPSVPLAAKAGRGVEVLTGAHYFVAPPSLHWSGRHYRWRPGHAPWEVSLADLPPIVVARLRKREENVARVVASGMETSEAHDFYAVLKSLDQGYVLLRTSGDWLVRGEVITLGPCRAGKCSIVIDGRITTGFIARREIHHHNSTPVRRDGGPWAATWLRFYDHDDKTIRQRLCELVPELARFGRATQRLTKRSPSPVDLRGDR